MNPPKIVFAFIGPIGAGKTTAAQLAASLVAGDPALVETPSFATPFRQAFISWGESAGIDVQQASLATLHPNKEAPMMSVTYQTAVDDAEPTELKIPFSYRSYMSFLDTILLNHYPLAEMLFHNAMYADRVTRGIPIEVDPLYWFVDDARKESHKIFLSQAGERLVTIAVQRDCIGQPVDPNADHTITNLTDDSAGLEQQLREILVSYGIPVKAAVDHVNQAGNPTDSASTPSS